MLFSEEWLRHYINPALSSCLLYTSDAADEEDSVDLGGRRISKKKKKKKKTKKKTPPTLQSVSYTHLTLPNT